MRYGSVIGLRAEKLDEYRRLHAAVWPQVAKMAADPVTQQWWDFCMPCQKPLADRKDGE